MSKTTDKLNETPSAKKSGFIFIDSQDLLGINKSMYSALYVSGIALSYLLVSLYIVPMVFTGTLSIVNYCLIHLGIALAWVGIGFLIKKFIIQNKLIKSGQLMGGDKNA